MTILTAHSGSDGFPANSLTFISHMAEAGVAAVELDIRRYKNRLYLSHDAQHPRVFLEDALALLADNHRTILLNADLKEEGLEQEVFRLTEYFSVPTVLSGTVSLNNIQPQQRQAIYFNLENLFDYTHDTSLTHFLKSLAHIRQQGIQTIQMDHRHLSAQRLQKIQESGLQLSLWTAQNEAETLRLLAYGVANVTTMTALPFARDASHK